MLSHTCSKSVVTLITNIEKLLQIVVNIVNPKLTAPGVQLDTKPIVRKSAEGERRKFAQMRALLGP